MRILALFAPQFEQFAIEFFSGLKDHCGELEVVGLVKGGRRVLSRIENGLSLKGIASDLFDYDAWENDALSLIKAGVLDVEECGLQDVDISKIIISDRDIGRCYVSGGLYPASRLSTLDSSQRLSYVRHQACLVAKQFRGKAFDAVFLYAIAGSLAMSMWVRAKYERIPACRLLHTRIGSIYCVSRSLGDSFDIRQVVPSSEACEKALAYLKRFSDDGAKPSYALYNHGRHREKNKIGRLALQCLVALVRTVSQLIRREKLSAVKHYPIVQAYWDIKWRLRGLIHSRYFVDNPPTGRYAVFFLHVEPEASTMVLSPQATDQLAVIEALSKWLPWDCNLVIKEHRPMLGKRPKGFYKRISSLARSYIVGPDVDSVQLLRGAACVAAITGTSAWEGALLDKPVLKFGDSPFDHVSPRIVRVEVSEMLSEAFNRAVESGSGTEDSNVLKYLSHVFEVGAEIDPQALWGDGSLPLKTQDLLGVKKLSKEFYLLVLER